MFLCILNERARADVPTDCVTLNFMQAYHGWSLLSSEQIKSVGKMASGTTTAGEKK